SLLVLLGDVFERPGLLSLTKERVFNDGSVPIVLLDAKRFFHRHIGEENRLLTGFGGVPVPRVHDHGLQRLALVPSPRGFCRLLGIIETVEEAQILYTDDMSLLLFHP